jgi:hypothetical protein
MEAIDFMQNGNEWEEEKPNLVAALNANSAD